MRTVSLLLSLMLFALLALDFSRGSSPWSQSASAPGNRSVVSTTTEAGDDAAPVEAPRQHVQASVSPSEERTPPQPVDEPSPAPEPEPEPSLAPDVATQIEAEVLRLTNIEREKQGLGTLAADTTLADIARAHSLDMIVRDFFEHDNPDGCSSSCRATAGGYRWQMIGENIYMMSGWDLSPEEAAIMIVNGWMSSPGHRANMLKSGYLESGVGVVIRDEAVYATALYGKER